MSNLTIREIIKLSPEIRKTLYQVSGKSNKNINQVIIDGNIFTDYSAFSFLNEKTFVKSPTRSSRGTMELESYAWFLTPHLKMDFSLMSIDSYRTMMKLIQSKNEFTVTCYDIVNDANVTHKMYFATEQMPKLWTIARVLNGNESWVELLGVNDYTVELIGTNNDVEEVTITYNLNKPFDAVWYGDIEIKESTPISYTLNVGAIINTGDTNENGENIVQDISLITFGDKYKFKYWCENSDGSGFKYINSNEYLFVKDKTLYAIWEAGA